MIKKQSTHGRGWHGDPAGHAAAGKQGGQKVKEERGEAFYSEIGRQGGRAAHQKGAAHEWDSVEAAEAGRKGGKVSRVGRNKMGTHLP